MGRLSKSLTAISVAAVLLAGGGAYALASSSGTITVCVKHAGGGLYKANKCAKRDRQLSWNAQGPAGASGATGATGATGAAGPQGKQGTPGTDGAPAAAQVAGWSGAIGTISNSDGLTFIGTTTSVTTTAADPTIVASGSASVGTSTGVADGYIAICYQASSGGALKYLDNNPGDASVSVTATTSRATMAASQTGAPGAGTWNVGVCGHDLSNSQAWDHNDWSVGWAMVTAGTPTSQ